MIEMHKNAREMCFAAVIKIAGYMGWPGKCYGKSVRCGRNLFYTARFQKWLR